MTVYQYLTEEQQTTAARHADVALDAFCDRNGSDRMEEDVFEALCDKVSEAMGIVDGSQERAEMEELLDLHVENRGFYVA